MMMQRVHTPEKCSCCRDGQRKSGMFIQRGFASRAADSDLEGEHQPRSLFNFNLANIPLHAPVQPKLAAERPAGGQEGDIAEKSAGPVVQRYVKVGLYEGSFGLDHIGVGVNSEKTKGFSPKAGLGREAEKGSWVEGEVKEDHDLIDNMTIRTNPQQEARLQAAMNRSESSAQKFHLYQHNCAQHGAQILNSAGLGVKSSPMPRAFFEGLKRQFEPGQEAKGQPVQGKFEPNALAAKPEQLEPRPNRTAMPDRLKAGIESLSGIDMSDVRVHANSDRPAGLGALAYTQGNQIYLGPGQERHLPHEAWHVVQQKEGRVRATGQIKRLEINDQAGLEEEADAMGLQAFRFIDDQSGTIAQRRRSGTNGNNDIVQRSTRYNLRSKQEKSAAGGAAGPVPEGYLNLDEFDKKTRYKYNLASRVENSAEIYAKLIEGRVYLWWKNPNKVVDDFVYFGDRDTDISELNRKHGAIAGYTWHHTGHPLNESYGTMQLVPTDEHCNLPHVGGIFISKM